jgi:hypothetical protein
MRVWQGKLAERVKKGDSDAIGEAKGEVQYWTDEVSRDAEQAENSKAEAKKVQQHTITVAYLKSVGQLFLTGVLLSGALFVVLSKLYTPTDKHWAYGTIGTLMGYWLKP